MKNKWQKFSPYGFYISLAAALVSLGFFIVRREFDNYLQISLGIMILGLAIGIFLDPIRVRTAFRGRQARYGSNALILILAFLGILVVVNYFGFENTKRWDLTEDKVNTLAVETLDIIDLLPEPVAIQAFFTPELGIDFARGLLEDYKFHSNEKISYTFIDPISDPVSAELAEISRDGSVVFWMGSRKEIVTTLTEQEFTAALIRLISGEDKIVYSLTGHGENRMEDSGEEGLSQAKLVLQSRNYIIRELNLLSAEIVPVDASLVVITGPIYPLETIEVVKLADYLSGGGSLILLQDSPLFTEFGDQEDYLSGYLQETWGILLGQDLIFDQTSFLGITAPVGAANPDHAISQAILGVATAFPTARSVRVIESGSGSVPVDLITTVNDGSWAETDLESLLADGDAAYNPERDILGPVSIAVATENYTTNGRVVVFGDVDFVMNANYTFFGNGDLFISAVDWAVGQDALINLTPKNQIDRYMLPPQPYLLNLILLFVVIILPGAVLVGGVIVWIKKRRRG